MTEQDPVLARLAELPTQVPGAELSRKIRAAALSRLVPANVHPLWSVAVAASVFVYLGWALHFTSRLY